MKKINTAQTLLALLIISCEPRREPTIEQTGTEVITPTLDSVATASPDSLNLDSLATTPDTLAAGKSDFYTIGNRQVGPVKINMPVNDFKKLISPRQIQEVNITREGRGHKAYEIKKDAADTKPALLAEEICEPNCRVWRVQVLDSAFKTPEGIRIGSTLGEVKKHYPISYLGPGETEIVAVSENKKLTFMLDVSKLPAKQVPFLNLKNTPNEVPVKGILLL